MGKDHGEERGKSENGGCKNGTTQPEIERGV